MSTQERRKGRGRRANYAPDPKESGYRKYLPRGWANWLGFFLFGLIGIAIFADCIAAISQGRGADPIAAFLLGCAFVIVTYLFATNRITD